MKRKVAIDADHILYDLAAPKSEAWKTKIKGESINKAGAKIGKLKKAFKARVQEYRDIAEIESVIQQWTLGKTVVVISDARNFRYDIHPGYKANRQGKEHTEVFLKLREWARKKYAPGENIEADDKVAFLVRDGAIGFTEDKDMLKGCEGIWFDLYHTRRHWVNLSKAEAKRFNLLQAIMGDLGDGIPGIKGIGVVKATKLLDDYGWSWNGVVNAYKHHSQSYNDALLTHRLVSLRQWSPDKGLQMHTQVKGN